MATTLQEIKAIIEKLHKLPNNQEINAHWSRVTMTSENQNSRKSIHSRKGLRTAN